MQLFKSVALATAVLVMLVCTATADITSVTHTIEISTTGDATHTMVIAADAESYTRFKINNTNAPTFLYNRGLGMGWQDLEEGPVQIRRLYQLIYRGIPRIWIH